MKRKIPENGTFFKILLEGSRNAYARLVQMGVFAFFDINGEGKTNEELMQLISNASPIFRIYVSDEAFKQSNWVNIGYKPLEEHLLNDKPVFFRQDLADPAKCWLVNTDPDYSKLVTPQECINLERDMVWGYKSAEDRLKDYFANKPNAKVEYYKVKL
jgi:hypothetical protein